MLVSGFARRGAGYPKEEKTLGDRIRVSRLDRGMSQREVAEVIGVKRGTINKWECNRGEPRACDMPAILKFLG
jgi:transcriptional regulator with XRE-family HTH domain